MTNPYTVVPYVFEGETKYQVHGPGLDADKWRYNGMEAAQRMCDLFNTIAAHAAKEPK